jgi:hypothetical protein
MNRRNIIVRRCKKCDIVYIETPFSRKYHSKKCLEEVEKKKNKKKKK